MKKEDINKEFNLNYEDKENPDEQVESKCINCVFETLPKLCEHNQIESKSESDIRLVREEDNQEHYRVKGFCKWFRDELWKTANQGKDLKSIVEKENEINLSLIIIVRDNDQDFQKTIDSIKKQKISVRRILFSIVSDDVDYLDFILNVKEVAEESGLDTKVQKVTDPEINKENLLIIDEGFKEIKSGYYSVFDLGCEIPEDWTYKLNKAINEDNKKIAYIRAFDGVNGITAQTMMHAFLYGNRGAPLEKKLKEGLDYDKNDTQMIFEWEEL